MNYSGATPSNGCTNEGQADDDRSGLIVDFPSRCRLHSTSSSPITSPINKDDTLKSNTADTTCTVSPSKSNEPMKKKEPKKDVRFSETSRMTLIEYPPAAEISRRWYLPHERDNLKRILLQDIFEMSCKLASTPMENISQDDLLMCIGMETLLSPDLSRAVKERKRRHSRTILIAQAQQWSRGVAVANIEELAALSEASSEWTRSRKQKLAAGYWDILKGDT